MLQARIRIKRSDASATPERAHTAPIARSPRIAMRECSLEPGEKGLGRASSTVEVGGALPPLLLVHPHGAVEHTCQACADDSDRGEGVLQHVGLEEGRRLVRGQLQHPVDALLRLHVVLVGGPPPVSALGLLTPRRVHREVGRHAGRRGAVPVRAVRAVLGRHDRLLVIGVLLEIRHDLGVRRVFSVVPVMSGCSLLPGVHLEDLQLCVPGAGGLRQPRDPHQHEEPENPRHLARKAPTRRSAPPSPKPPAARP
mmetsp:Transcript_63912/g.157249  ORF Transcript_63912/g.157249 Transcript_63912/m.157249 type:complete len:254 (-) Transcript_63912:79-840(-)